MTWTWHKLHTLICTVNHGELYSWFKVSNTVSCQVVKWHNQKQLGINLCLVALQWRHNEHDGVSNHRRLHCFLNCWFRRWSKETSKLRVTGLCEGNSPLPREFPAQKTSNAVSVPIWWRHHRNTRANRRWWIWWADPRFAYMADIFNTLNPVRYDNNLTVKCSIESQYAQ